MRRPDPRRLRDGLGLAFLATLLVALLGTVIVASTVRLVEQRATRLLRQEAENAATTLGQALGRQFAHAVDLGIPLAEIPGVPAYLRTMIGRIPVVQAVAIDTTAGRRLYLAGDAAALTAARARVARFPIRHHGRIIARVSVAAIATRTGATLSWLYWSVALAVLIAAGSSGIATAILARRRLLRSRRILAQALSRLARGDFSPPLVPSGRGAVARAFGALAGFCAEVNAGYRELTAQADAIRAIDFDGSLNRRIEAVLAPLQQRFRFAGARRQPATVHTSGRRRRGRLLLRGRITLLVMATVLLLCLGLGVLGIQRERLLEQRFASVAISGQEALWRQTVAAEVARLRALIPQLRDAKTVLAALDSGDQGAIAAAAGPLVRRLQAGGELDQLEFVAPSGALLYSSAGGVERHRILDAGSLDTVLAGTVDAGLRQMSAQRYLLAVSFPVRTGQGVIAAATLAVRAERILQTFARALAAPSLLVGLRGRLLDATAARFRALLPALPLREASASQLRHGDTLYSVTGVPVDDLHGHQLGLVVTFRDATASLGQARRMTSLFLVGVGGFLLLVLVGLYGYLRRALRPLEEGIGVLRALAQGDTSVSLDSTRQDEIGRIAEAVRSFRRDLIALAETRRRQEQQRRRQERFIHQQMAALAAALDDDARQALLADLQRAVDGGQPAPAAPVAGAQVAAGDDQLGLLAAVLQQLSARIVGQHRRLSGLVAELREALATKTQLVALQQELAIARQVQQAILPRDFPRRPEFEVHADMLPAREVGGDFYDFFAVDGEHIAVVVADVSDKGVPAALFMAVTRTLLKATAPYEPSPAACVSRLNELLAADNEQMMFVTLFYGLLHLPSGRLTYVNAGHNAPYLISATGRLTELPGTGGVALAVLAGQRYREQVYPMAVGDTLFLYTDGVTEAFDDSGAEFGEARLQALLAARAGSAPVAAIAGLVGDAVRTFAGAAAQSDDLTCLSLRYWGTTGQPGSTREP